MSPLTEKQYSPYSACMILKKNTGKGSLKISKRLVLYVSKGGLKEQVMNYLCTTDYFLFFIVAKSGLRVPILCGFRNGIGLFGIA